MLDNYPKRSKEYLAKATAAIILGSLAVTGCGKGTPEATPTPTATATVEPTPESIPCPVPGLNEFVNDDQICTTPLSPEQISWTNTGGDLAVFAARDAIKFKDSDVEVGLLKEYEAPDNILSANIAGLLFNKQVVSNLTKSFNAAAQTNDKPELRSTLQNVFDDYVTIDYNSFVHNALFDKINEITTQFGANSTYEVLPVATDGTAGGTEFNKMTHPETGFGKVLKDYAHITDGVIRIQVTTYTLDQSGITDAVQTVEIPLSDEESFVLLSGSTTTFPQGYWATKVGLSKEGADAPYLSSNS